jgi:hypothetical protein
VKFSKRGRIISSGGSTLPLSHSKRLNVENTPILVLYRDSFPSQVYPHMLSKHYVSIDDGLNTIMETGLPEKGECLLEPLLQKLIITNPSDLEKGTLVVGSERRLEWLILSFKGRYVVVVRLRSERMIQR